MFISYSSPSLGAVPSPSRRRSPRQTAGPVAADPEPARRPHRRDRRQVGLSAARIQRRIRPCPNAAHAEPESAAVEIREQPETVSPADSGTNTPIISTAISGATRTCSGRVRIASSAPAAYRYPSSGPTSKTKTSAHNHVTSSSPAYGRASCFTTPNGSAVWTEHCTTHW